MIGSKRRLSRSVHGSIGHTRKSLVRHRKSFRLSRLSVRRSRSHSYYHPAKVNCKSVQDCFSGYFCCTFDYCPLRGILMGISAGRIVYYLEAYTRHTSRVQRSIVQYYEANLLLNTTVSLVGTQGGLAAVDISWHFFAMAICLVEMCLYAHLFAGALLIFPKPGWNWFYSCWAVSLGHAVLYALVIPFSNDVHVVEAAWVILVSTVVIYYEMWLWAYHSKRIRLDFNTYKGLKMFVPAKPKKKQLRNPKFTDEIKETRRLKTVHPWDDTSYAVAHEYLLTHSKYSKASVPPKTYTKQELRARVTGLTNKEVDIAVEKFYKDGTNLA